MLKKDLHFLYQKAMSLRDSGQEHLAEECLEEILEWWPQNIPALREMGSILSEQGDYDKATGFYKEILTIMPDDPYALNELGVIYGKQGEFKAAIEFLNKILEKSPDDTYVLSKLGLMYLRDGEVEKAIAHFERITQISRPEFTDQLKDSTDLVRTTGDLRKRDKQFIVSGRVTTANAIATCFAHQINNPLQIIQNSIDSLYDRVRAAGGVMDEDLENLHNSADRIHELIRHLYRLITNDSGNREFILINKVILSAYALFDKQLQNRNINVEMGDIQDPQNTMVVCGNSVELEQVFINLFANARDALASTSDPRILVTMVQSGEKEVTIYFSDNGEGISEENLGRVFDSLFTTKSDGTGLGLWLCLSVISQMGGKISVDSTLGEGTTFTICLPTR